MLNIYVSSAADTNFQIKVGFFKFLYHKKPLHVRLLLCSKEAENIRIR